MTITPPGTPKLPLVEHLRSSRLPPPARRREIREQAGASLRQVAAELGVSPFAVSSWERSGGCNPRPAHAVRYRRLLDDLAALAEEEV